MTNENEKITVWWIDDDHADETGPRNAECNEFARQAGAMLNLVPIHPADFERLRNRRDYRNRPGPNVD